MARLRVDAVQPSWDGWLKVFECFRVANDPLIATEVRRGSGRTAITVPVSRLPIAINCGRRDPLLLPPDSWFLHSFPSKQSHYPLSWL
jgi:hypothetical protein